MKSKYLFILMVVTVPATSSVSSAQLEHQAYIKAETSLAGYGSRVAVDGDLLVVSRRSPLDRVYVYRRDGSTGWRFSTEIRPPMTVEAPADRFGESIAISGETIVVGANAENSAATGVNGDFEDNSAPDSGAAFVYVRSGTDEWVLDAYLKAFNTDSDDRFGSSVAIDRDMIVVGSIYESSSATGVGGNPFDNSTFGAGAAYVYRRSEGQWSPQAYLKADSIAEESLFGTSVAIYGDHILVGAPGHPTELNEASGAAFSFSRSGVNWSGRGRLSTTSLDDLDLFGDAVAIGVMGSGSDSRLLAAVGAPFEDGSDFAIGGNPDDNAALGAGAVFLFSAIGEGPWSNPLYLKAFNGDASDNFGRRLAMSASSEFQLLVGVAREDSFGVGVGGISNDNSFINAGASYLYSFSVSPGGSIGIGPQTYIKAINTDAGDDFGTAVAIDGKTLVIGASFEDSAATGIGGDPFDNSDSNSGAVYVLGLPPSIFSDRFGVVGGD